MQILVGILVLYVPYAVSADFSGLWTDNCEKASPDLAHVIVRAHSDGPYQVGFPRVHMSMPTEIHGDPDFEVVGEDEVVYKGNRLYRCERFTVPEYDAINPKVISNHLVGDWAIMYRAINGRKTLISDGRVGLPDLSFFDDGKLLIHLKDSRQESSYEVNDSNLALHVEEGEVFRILLIDDQELHLTMEKEPSAGVLIFHRRKN